MRSLLLSAVATALTLAGCSAGTQTLLHNVTLSQGGSADDHITKSVCVEPIAVAEWAAIAWPLLVHHAHEQGYIDASQVKAVVSDPLGIRLCLVPEPTICAVGGAAGGACETVGGRTWCARSAGCAHYNHVWVSKTWPPVCEDNAYGEFNRGCAEAPDPGHDWTQTLVHEMGNIIVFRYLPKQYYDSETRTKFYQPGGPVQLVKAHLKALRQ